MKGIEVGSDRSGSAEDLRLQQSPLQQDVQVAAAVGDQEHVDVVLYDPVDDAVGLEEDFAVFPDPQGQQFFREGPALGGSSQAGERSQRAQREKAKIKPRIFSVTSVPSSE